MFYGEGLFFGKQVAAVALCIVHSFLFTFGMLFVIDKVFKMKIQEEEKQENLDNFEHGEVAYIDNSNSVTVVHTEGHTNGNGKTGNARRGSVMIVDEHDP